jgi:hypothetical protein
VVASRGSDVLRRSDVASIEESASETIVAFGLHGALLIGPRHPIAARVENWSRTLSTFEIDLKRDGMGGRSWLRYECIVWTCLGTASSRRYSRARIAAGEIVTTQAWQARRVACETAETRFLCLRVGENGRASLKVFAATLSLLNSRKGQEMRNVRNCGACPCDDVTAAFSGTVVRKTTPRRRRKHQNGEATAATEQHS